MEYTAQEFLKYKEKEQLTYTDDEVIQLMEEYASEFKLKSEKWDQLDNKIGKYYEIEEDSMEEEDGSLLEIGETACIAFGYL